MELKFGDTALQVKLNGCSNCTFMELKSQQTGSQTCDTNVLIVPLWN